MNTSAKKAITRRVVGATCVAIVGIGGAACASDDPSDDPTEIIETPIDDLETPVEDEVPSDDGG